MDLVDFLRTRLDEDEVRAERMGHYNPDDAGYYACPATRTEPIGDLLAGEENCDCGMPAERARALADVGSNRQIIGYCQAAVGGYDEMVAAGVLELLAIRYADHPDYQLAASCQLVNPSMTSDHDA